MKAPVNNYHDEVLYALEKVSEPDRAEAIKADRRSSLDFLGVRTPALRQVVKKGFSFYAQPEARILQIWDEIWTILAVYLVLASVTSGVACSIEIWPIIGRMDVSEIVLAGRIESTQMDTTDIGFAYLKTARMSIEKPLKGGSESGAIELTFDPDMWLSSCGDLFEGYRLGRHVILMFREEQGTNSYPAPGVPPILLWLDSASYEETVLYQYVASTAAKGLPPVRVAFAGDTQQVVGKPLGMAVTISNEMDHDLSVELNGARTPTDQFRLTLGLGGVAPGGSAGSSKPPAPFRVGAGEILVIPLDEYFSVTAEGPYLMEGFLYLPNGDQSYENPMARRASELWSFEATFPTSVGDSSWGAMKKATERR